MALGAAHSLHSPNVLHVYGKKIKLRQFPQLMWFFWLFTPRLSSVVFTWLKEIPSIFCLPMLQYLAQYQNIPPRPPYYAFFAFLWLFMGRITARFTHTGDGQRLRGLVTDYQISGNYRTAFSQTVSGSFSAKGGINKKHCNNVSARWSKIISVHFNERFVWIMIWTNKPRVGKKVDCYARRGTGNPDC